MHLHVVLAKTLVAQPSKAPDHGVERRLSRDAEIEVYRAHLVADGTLSFSSLALGSASLFDPR